MPTCAGCGLKVENKIRACPHCGAAPRSSIRTATLAVAVIGAAVVLVNFAAFLSPAAEPATTRAEPVAAIHKPPPDPAVEARIGKAMLVATLIKTGLRDPDSVTWLHLRANDDASVVCIEYRARNGFGGLNLERTAYAKGRLSSESSSWSKNCAAKKLFDLDYLRHSL